MIRVRLSSSRGFEAVGEAVADDRGGLVVREPGEPVHVYRRRADAIYRERRLTS